MAGDEFPWESSDMDESQAKALAFLTGRTMAPEVIDVVDPVTEMVKIGRAFDDTIRADKGIDS